MSDNQEIESLYTSHEPNFSAYTKSQDLYLPDSNNGNYSQNQIVFNCQNLAGSFIPWRDAYLQLNYNVTTAGTPYPDGASVGTLQTLASPLTMKGGYLDLIHGIQVFSPMDNKMIINDTSIQFINNFRLLIERNSTWEKTEASALCFAKDTNITSATLNTANSISPFGFTSPNLTALAANAGIDQRQTLYNDGLLNRVKFFWAHTGSNLSPIINTNLGGIVLSNTYKVQANIPLRLIHDFFDKLDFAMANINWNFNFLYNYSTYNPLTTVSTITGAGVVTTTPVPNVPVFTSSRLVYRKVILSAKELAYVKEQLKVGYKKSFSFISTDTYINPSGIKGTAINSQFVGSISSGTSRPLRVWVATFPSITNSFLTSTYSVWAPSVPHTATNVILNNDKYYDNDLVLPMDYYRELERAMPGYGESNFQGSLVSYSDFVTTHRITCMDVSRNMSNLASPDTPVSIQLQTTMPTAATNTCDTIVVVEKLKHCTLKISTGEVEISVY